jgi:SAM-dependent methyltransferase
MTEKKESVQIFDPIWDEIYGRREQLNRYPVGGVISFLFRNRSHLAPHRPLRVIEVGCGACNNLWFAAREGCEVAGIDSSAAAIEFGRARFAQENLDGDLRVGDFTELPFEDGAFDMAINRAALTHTGLSAARKAVEEVARVVRPGGMFYNEIFGTRTTAGGDPGPDGVTLNATGRLSGVGQICFYDEDRMDALFAGDWQIEGLQHAETTDFKSIPHDVVGSWTVVAERLP